MANAWLTVSERLFPQINGRLLHTYARPFRTAIIKVREKFTESLIWISRTSKAFSPQLVEVWKRQALAFSVDTSALGMWPASRLIPS